MENGKAGTIHIAGPIVTLVFTVLTSIWGCISFVLTVLLAFTIIIPIAADLIYIVLLLTMTIINVVALIRYVKKRKANKAYMSCLILSIVSSAIVLANIICVTGYVLLAYGLNRLV
jgi:hypothetical protein